MDESYDEPKVPDSLLMRKRRLDSVDSSISSTRQSELGASPAPKISCLEISSTTKTSSDLHISSGTETFEDISVNEPNFFPHENISKSEQNNNNEINDLVLATDKHYEIHKDELFIHKSCEVRLSRAHLEIDSSLHRENELWTGYCETALLNGTEIFSKETCSKVNNEHHFNVSNKDTLTGCNQVMKCAELNSLKSKTESVHSPSQSSEEPASSNENNGLKHILSVVRDAKVIEDIVPNKDFNDIYQMLLEHRDNGNRLDIVTDKLTRTEETLPEGLIPSIDTFQEARQVPLVSDIESSTHSVVSSVEINNTVTMNDSFLENDPLLQDMRTIAKMFPEKDRNEIYALLEANFNTENRLEKVVHELLHVDNANLEWTQQSQSHGSIYTMDNTISSEVMSDILGDDLEKMRSIFPDCDPNYLYEKLESMKDAPSRTDVLAAQMFEKRNYPKLKDLLDKEKEKEEENKSKKAKHLTITIEEFFQKFPDPVKTFVDDTKELSDTYKKHSQIFLQNEFPMFKHGYLTKILRKHNEHLYLAYQEVSALLLKTPLAKRKHGAMFFMVPRSSKRPMPDIADEYFYHELWFIYNELSILDHIKQKDEQRKLKIETAKVTGEVYECCCCYDDECLLEDLASCPEGHLFCKTCIVRSTEAAFGEMKTKFPCLTGECDQDIPISYLQTIIPANLFSKIVRRLQEEEVQQANIPDLVTCPFCPFAAIMSNPHDKVFKCLNPDCLKESCRLCQELNHIPLRCNEVEKKTETDMRVYIENKISEAVMRKCHKCGKRFVKEDGCNKMTCVCGATSCYACKAADINYDHFNNNTECAVVDANTIHQLDIENAAISAKNQYLLDHPEAADVELKADINNMIKSFKNSNQDAKYRRHLVDESDTDEEESDESEYADYL